MTKLVPLAVSIAQAAELSAMGRTWLYAAIKRRDLKTRKAGRRTLIEVEELRRFIASLPASSGDHDAA